MNQSKISTSLVLKCLAGLSILLTFLPSFSISFFTSESLGIFDLFSLAEESSGALVFLLIVLIILPIVMLLIQFININGLNIKKKIIIVLLCAAANMLFWIIFNIGLKSSAGEFHSIISVTFWYVLNLLVQILIIIITSLILANKIQIDDVLSKDTINNIKNNSRQPSQATNEKIVIHCSQCGQKMAIPKTNKTLSVKCPYCGHDFIMPGQE